MNLPQAVVRSGTSADIDRVKELFALSQGDIVGKRGEQAIVSATPDLWQESSQTSVIEIDGVVLGFCSTRVLNESELVADWFYILPEARRVGLGSMLMQFVVELAKSKGCERISSVALPGDAKTKNFFESFGLKASLLTVGKELS